MQNTHKLFPCRLLNPKKYKSRCILNTFIEQTLLLSTCIGIDTHSIILLVIIVYCTESLRSKNIRLIRTMQVGKYTRHIQALLSAYINCVRKILNSRYTVESR